MAQPKNRARRKVDRTPQHVDHHGHEPGRSFAPAQQRAEVQKSEPGHERRPASHNLQRLMAGNRDFGQQRQPNKKEAVKNNSVAEHVCHHTVGASRLRSHCFHKESLTHYNASGATGVGRFGRRTLLAKL